MSLGSCQNTVTVEFLELARVTICTMLLGLGNPQNVSFMIIYIYIYIYPLAFMGNAVHEFMLAFGSHNPTHHGEILH